MPQATSARNTHNKKTSTHALLDAPVRATEKSHPIVIRTSRLVQPSAIHRRTPPDKAAAAQMTPSSSAFRTARVRSRTPSLERMLEA